MCKKCEEREILEEACKKQKIDPEDFELRHYNRTLDLSLPVRFSSLPNNAQLELKPATKSRTECMVTVALQLESGERITKDFAPLTTIYDVLEQCLMSESISLQEIGEPVCIYMRQKIIGDAIKSTTLRSLGLTSGKAIIRLLYRKPETLEDQAHVTSPLTAAPPLERNGQDPACVTSPLISEPASEVDKENQPLKKYSVRDATPLEIDVRESDNYQQSDSPIPEQIRKQARIEGTTEQNSSCIADMDVDDNESYMKEDTRLSVNDKNSSFNYEKETVHTSGNTETSSFDQKSTVNSESELQEDIVEEIGDIKYIGGRHAVVYSLDDISSAKRADLPEEFFELTVNDVRYLMETYRKERTELENQPLLTKEQRDRQILEKLSRYNETVIRVYFPERLVLQAVFNATETVQTVQDFIRGYLTDKNLNFYLYITPPKEKLSPSKSLLEAMLIPAAVTYFGCDIQLPFYLMENLKNQLSDPRAAALAASESRKESNTNISPSISQENANNLVTNTKVDDISIPTTVYQPPTQSQGKVPKWLKLNKK
ncbi:tether containing UBX domain for GLUT4 [Nephila pilipes]|uniref:Tether containing UBX domain for GLUT4 n=1 Tax=Nephila pilipes TaxID=299642 RepID=A0A8X6PMM1_NEPPI|nr:tether containing UBX domain for GLUT4 [Nephila pilipes]